MLVSESVFGKGGGDAARNRPERASVVTVGAFDGVHLGHQHLMKQVNERAHQLGCSSVAITFDPHPAFVVRPESAPKLLTDLDQKLELIAATGIDHTLVVRFDQERANEEAEAFIEDVLIQRLGARAVVIGHDFHFGRGRRGNAEMLRTIGASSGFEVIEPTICEIENDTVCSTLIRSCLERGEVERASRLLGRPHEVRGLVVMGDGRGRDLGYPTANVHIDSQIQLPAGGVYAGFYVDPDGVKRPSAISLGTRPTFYSEGVELLEVHLLDYEGDLYGQQAHVQFTHRLRGQEKFDSIDELIAQMNLDAEAAKKLTDSDNR